MERRDRGARPPLLRPRHRNASASAILDHKDTHASAVPAGPASPAGPEQLPALESVPGRTRAQARVSNILSSGPQAPGARHSSSRVPSPVPARDPSLTATSAPRGRARARGRSRTADAPAPPSGPGRLVPAGGARSPWPLPGRRRRPVPRRHPVSRNTILTMIEMKVSYLLSYFDHGI